MPIILSLTRNICSCNSEANASESQEEMIPQYYTHGDKFSTRTNVPTHNGVLPVVNGLSKIKHDLVYMFPLIFTPCIRVTQ